MWKNHGFFGTESCDFSIEKANMLENTLFYVNQGYQPYKDDRKLYHNDLYIIAQIIPLSIQPKNIESYEFKDDEVKILRIRYDPISSKFLGIEYCVGLITVKNDPEEHFFNYGCNKYNSKMLYSTKKLKIPSCFKGTIFGVHKMQYDGGAFSEESFSKILFYLPSTVDRSEKIKKYRAAVVSYMKKVAEQSSQNLKRNADAFLSSINHDNEKLLWPNGKRTKEDKFALTY